MNNNALLVELCADRPPIPFAMASFLVFIVFGLEYEGLYYLCNLLIHLPISGHAEILGAPPIF